MATPVRARAAPSCLSCMRRLLDVEIGPPLHPLFVQIRGKKKQVHSETIPVKLVSNINGYGPAGVTLRVKPGQMRNYWYPMGIAHYIIGEELREVKRNPNLVADRDYYFGKSKPEAEVAKAVSDIVRIQTQLLSPQRSEELLQNLLPSNIEFFRQPISTGETKLQFPKREVPQRMEQISPQAIYGSVSTEDILNSIRELLKLRAAEESNKDAGRVVLQAEDIKLVRSEVDTGIEDGRIKFLGEFEFELHVKGGNAIRRKVLVNATA